MLQNRDHRQHARQKQQDQRECPQHIQRGRHAEPRKQGCFRRLRLQQSQTYADQQKTKPQGRGNICHDTREQHGAVNRLKTGFGDEPEVNQIALTPPAVSLELFHQVGGLLLVTAFQLSRKPGVIACTAHQRGFHEIVRQNFARKPATTW